MTLTLLVVIGLIGILVFGAVILVMAKVFLGRSQVGGVHAARQNWMESRDQEEDGP